MARSNPVKNSAFRRPHISFAVMKPKRMTGRPLSPEHKELLKKSVMEHDLEKGHRDYVLQVINE